MPLHHETLLNGLVYNSIRDSAYRDQLHNKGVTFEKRQFRMFCYSRLQGSYKIQNKQMVFTSPVSFLFSAHDEKLLLELTSSMFTRDVIMIGSKTVKLHSIQQIDQQLSSHVRIRMITPVTAYSTFMLNNKKKTFYWSPRDEEFGHQVQENAIKKFVALYGQAPADNKLILTPKDPKQLLSRTVIFKHTFIKGWMGDFILQGNEKLIRIVYDVGLSAKNSNGLGLFEVVTY